MVRQLKERGRRILNAHRIVLQVWINVFGKQMKIHIDIILHDSHQLLLANYLFFYSEKFCQLRKKRIYILFFFNHLPASFKNNSCFKSQI